MSACFPPNKRRRCPTLVTFPPLNFSFCNPSTQLTCKPLDGSAGGTPGTQEGVPFPRSRGAGAQRLAALPSRGRMLPGWSTLRITRSRRCDQTFQQLGPTVLAMHLAIICWRRRPAPCSCDWLAAPGQGRIGLSRPHSLLWLLLLSKPSKEIIPCFIDNL